MRKEKINKKQFVIITVSILIVLEVLCIAINNIRIDNMQKNLQDIRKSNAELAIKIEQNKGREDYLDSSDDTWPGKGYKFNSSKSVCTDGEDENHYDMITFESGRAIVKSDKLVYCTLYFDISDSTEFTFTLGGKEKKEVSTSEEIDAYFTWDNDNVTHYCIGKSNVPSNCTDWHEFDSTMKANKEGTVKLKVERPYGDKTFYAFLKEGSTNTIVEEYRTDSIYVDFTKPTCSYTADSAGVHLVREDDLSLDDGGTRKESVESLYENTYTTTVKDKAGNENTCSITISSQTSKNECKIQQWPCIGLGMHNPGAMTNISCSSDGQTGANWNCQGNLLVNNMGTLCVCSTKTSCPDGSTKISGTDYCQQ